MSRYPHPYAPHCEPDGPCVICNPSVGDGEHCPDCTNDGSEGGYEDDWCEGVKTKYPYTPWPCPTRKLANEALGGGERG